MLKTTALNITHSPIWGLWNTMYTAQTCSPGQGSYKPTCIRLRHAHLLGVQI